MTAAADEPQDVRTGLFELSEDECWRRLRSEEVGRLAVSVGGYPDIFPVNYRVWEGSIVVRTEAGTKLAAATLGHAVAFEIDQVDRAAKSGWSVVVSGTAREPEHLEDVVELDELDLDIWVSTPKSRWLVITPESITGRELPS